MHFHFPIVIIDEDFRSENTSGLGIRALAQAIESEGFDALGVTSYHDLSQFAQQQSQASAFILSIDDEEFTHDIETALALNDIRTFIREVRRRNLDVPIYVYGETKTARHIPNDILRELHGVIHMFEDTPECEGTVPFSELYGVFRRTPLDACCCCPQVRSHYRDHVLEHRQASTGSHPIGLWAVFCFMSSSLLCDIPSPALVMISGSVSTLFRHIVLESRAAISGARICCAMSCRLLWRSEWLSPVMRALQLPACYSRPFGMEC